MNNYSSFRKSTFLFLSLFIAVMVSTLLMQGCRNEQEATSPLTIQEQSQPTGTPVEGQYIVVLKNTRLGKNAGTQAMVTSLMQTYNISTEQLLQVYEDALSGFAVKMSKAQADEMRTNSSVAYIEQDQWYTLDDQPGTPVFDKVTAQTTPWGITRVGGAGDGTGKVAWIIDTGIDFTHPDLNVDVARSKNFVSNKSATDDNGHGTHVSGTIAAINNSSYVVGVAAGATVVAVKVLNRQGSGTYSQIIAGVNYVAANGKSGDAANMSLGGGASTTLDNAVKNAAGKGIKFAIAAGNSGANANNYSPARSNGTNIYTVSAINSSDVFASWSNYGNPPVDYAAPGVSVLSLWKNGGTNTISGTSMATPHVCGILLLGNVATNGYAKSDPDGNPDPIAHR